MPNTKLNPLKGAVKTIFDNLLQTLDERTVTSIIDYFANLPAEIELIDEQREIIDLRYPEFETLAKRNVSELISPHTIEQLEIFSKLAQSQTDSQDITVVITELYLAFLDVWNPELMKCGEKLKKAFEDLSQPIKPLRTPSSTIVARENFQMVLFELLNRPRNAIYHFLNEKQMAIDIWFTNSNLSKMAILSHRKGSSNKNNNNLTSFHSVFRQFLDDLAKTYDLETNELILLLKHKNNRAYDDTQQYAKHIEHFLTNSKTSSLSLETFLIEKELMSENVLKKKFHDEVTKFSKLFEAYCNVVTNRKEKKSKQQVCKKNFLKR